MELIFSELGHDPPEPALSLIAALNSIGRLGQHAGCCLVVRIRVNAPSARTAHTAVWDGTEMIVWGGGTLGSGVGVATGGRYVPSTDIWTPTSTTGAPGARYGHTAIWTGSEMIVWGGLWYH